MPSQKPNLIDKFTWKDNTLVAEVYKTQDVSEIKQFKQVQAVCFTDDGYVVLYEHKDGWYGLPGGHIEGEEDIEQALQREIREEISAELNNWGVLGYEKIYSEREPKDISYFLRCWARVELLDTAAFDPDGKVVSRVILPLADAHKKIGYGKRGKFWLDAARLSGK